MAHPSEDYDHDKFFSVYTPQEGDGCSFEYDAGGAITEEVCKESEMRDER
jgi:hypothetical protein